MSFEDFIKTLQENREIPGGIEVPQGALRLGPDEVAEDAPVLLASASATELSDEEIQGL
jgi:hypothetical protein